ncbi:hypothetical protein P3S68_019035 [Capsicum galapagoense]
MSFPCQADMYAQTPTAGMQLFLKLLYTPTLKNLHLSSEFFSQIRSSAFDFFAILLSIAHVDGCSTR